MKGSKLGGNFDSIFDDLLDDGENIATDTLKISEIEPNKRQPRKKFDTDKLNALADSIRQHGLIQPITVRPYEGTYQIIAGERRWRASKIAGLTEVPVRVLEITDETAAQLALIENLQREDLNPIEEANGYKNLIDVYGMTQENVAKIVGKARSSVTNALRLLGIPEELRDDVIEGKLTRGHCKALLSLNDKDLVLQTGKRVVDEDMSVRTLERLVASLNAEPKESTPFVKKRNIFYAEAELSISDALGGKPVRIAEGKSKNTLQIDFVDEAELKEIVSHLSIR
jgi:ParB family chromosome partitioning protein